jgi:ferric-dicitrate binding protein FerR (iron transport regulator)
MEESKIHILLQRFLDKETTDQENIEILNWVSVSEENRAEFKRLHQLSYLSGLKKFQSEIDIDSAWDKLSDQFPRAKRQAGIVYMSIFKRIAVAVLIFLAIGFGGLWTKEHFYRSDNKAIVQFEAPKGEKSIVTLADGSHVWLNSQTVLKYDALNPRNVTMSGEAYFEIKKDPAHPFEITTYQGLKVKVTGTRFNLRCFDNEPFIETTLDEGEVIVSERNSRQYAVLAPGQQAKFDIRNKEMEVRKVSTEIFSIWRNNELRFNDISYAELIPRIERWYGVSIELDPGISKTDRFTMSVKTESLRELLNMMKLTSNFNYEINGEKVELVAK